MRHALPFFVFGCLVSGLATAATLLNFTPQGSTKKASQVQARFDTDMVDFGSGRAPSPFKVDCPARGDGRWLDARTFVHDFVGELPGGIRCTFTLTQQKNLKGEPLTGQTVFTFDSGGPSLIRSIPSADSSYVNEEDPMLLIFDAPIKMDSLQGKVFYQVPQRADTIGFEMVPDPEKYLSEQWPYLLEELKLDPKFYLLIKPKERLPGDTDITLVIDKGVTSPSGVVTQAAQTLHFKTRPPFRASFYCQREKAGGPCTPHDDFAISFNDRVAEKDQTRVRVVNAKNQDVEIKRDGSYFTIPGPHPENSSYRIEIPQDLKDERGRILANAKEFPLTVRVGDYGPLLKFPGDFGVLEAAHPIWPLNMRKVEGQLNGRLYKAASRPDAVLHWYKTIQSAGNHDKRENSIFSGMAATEFKNVPLKKPNGPDAFEVIGVPLAGPGFYVMEVGSARLGEALLDKKRPMFARAAVLVTNLAVHVKKGRQGTLVWVTSLDKGEPVAGVDIAIGDCKGKVLISGKTDSSGLYQHNAALPPSRGSCYGTYDYEGESSDYLVTASKDADFSFTLTHWNNGIESWRFQLPWDSASSDLQVHSVLDRTLLRLGETVSMLHVARRRVKDGLAFPRRNDLKNSARLQHIGSEKHYTVPLVWNDGQGRAENAWKIPADAPLGWYSIMIGDQESGRFRVDEFRLATMRGRLQAKESSLIAPKEIIYDFDVSYLSGGPASNLPVRLRRSFQGAYQPRFSGYEDFDFQTTPVDREPDKPKEQQDSKVETKDVTLDKAGTGALAWKAPTIDRPTRVLTEMEFPDASGEARTVAIEHKIWPSGVVIGMKGPWWLQKGENLNLSGVTLDPKGQVVAQVDVRVRAFKEDILSHRRRGVGGTYVYEHKTVIKELGIFCETKSDDKGLWNCQKPLSTSGNILLQAEAKDREGRLAISSRSVWVAGERLWFLSEDHDRIDLIPEKRHYEPGEKARIQVKMPFAQATVLMATERDGMILDTKVLTLDSRQPFLDVPIPRSYAPNVFVSAWAVRGRVKGTEPFLKVDLGKPAHKLGITELKVGWRQHTLDVKIQTDKQVYKIREKAQARIEVKAPHGQPLPAGSIATVAVVDEALLELMGNQSWDLLSAMMSERAYGIDHATSAMQVIGKRHFGLKALPHGGGGGSNPTREVLDALILWKGKVALQDGVATLEIPLKDNLSSFRIVGVAQAGADMFGTGSTAIQTQQDISLIAGLPPLVREGDKWQALVTVRNRSQIPQQVTIKARMDATPLPDKSVTLKADESQLVVWDLEVPKGISELKYTFDAVAAQGGQDSLRFSQQVKPSVPLRVLQASLMVLTEAQSLPVALPEKADPNRGGLDLSFSAGPGLDMLQGTRIFFQEYPYTCLEQRVSSAIGLDNRKAWDHIVRDLDSYIDQDGLLKYFPLMRHGSMTLTAYVLSVSHEAGLSLPKSKQDALRYALKRAVDGEISDHEYRMPGDQLAYRKIMALEALSRFDAEPVALIKNMDVKPELLPHATLIDLVQAISRSPHDEALKELKEKSVQHLQARLRLSGTQYALAGEEYNQISSLLSSPDSNAARLLLLGLEQNLWASDHARMLEGLLRRQKRGAWSTTIANVWGTLALKNYLKQHPPAGSETKATVTWQDKTQTVGLKEKTPLHLAWPETKTTLTLGREGQGDAWATVISRAAVPLTQTFQAGYRLEKILHPVEQKVKGKWSRGDIVKVTFNMEAGSDQTWVVLADPIPAGARILNASLRDDAGQGAGNYLAPSYVERRHEGYFAYFEFMPLGRHSVSYVMQVNNPGLFQLSSTRLEAMYAPDQYAELPNAPVQVD
jgi:uncharacterized protein YfaS (alpha-2-macroglobulin family)